MADVQIAVIDQQNTQIALAAPGVQGPVGEGVPSGGAANQVLFKQSGTDYDTTWGSVTSAMIGDLQIVNADVAANAEIAVSKLADGAAGQIVQTDSAGTGVEWSSTTNLPLGSAAAPAYAFQGDANTGIYSPGADQLAISTNGTGRLFVDANGVITVGPGTTGLYISPNTGGAAYITTNSTSAATNFVLGTSTDIPIRFIQNNTERMRLTSTGLGVGTSTPNSPFEVGLSGVNIDGSMGALPAASADSAVFIGRTTATGSAPFDQSGSLIYRARVSSVAGRSSHIFYTGSPSGIRMVIDETGRVGVGTASPGGLLDLNGTSGNNQLRFGLDGTPRGIIEASSDGLQITGASTSRNITFVTAGTERARVDTSGRLLVGTSSARAIPASLVAYARLQLEGGDNNTSAFSITNTTNGPSGRAANIRTARIRGTGAVVADDILGLWSFYGHDGTDFIEGAKIQGQVDGTPGANDMPGRLVFSTTAGGASFPTERVRITSNGRAVFGGLTTTTGSTTSNILVGTSNSTTGAVGIEGYTTITTERFHASFVNGNGVVGSISTNGSATAFNTSSDYRLKENIVPLTGAADRLNQLQVHRFNFIADPDKTVDGFIAHEAQAVVPEAVTGEKDAVDENGDPIYQGIDQSKLVPLLTAALQEALAEIESLKARVTALEP